MITKPPSPNPSSRKGGEGRVGEETGQEGEKGGKKEKNKEGDQRKAKKRKGAGLLLSPGQAAEETASLQPPSAPPILSCQQPYVTLLSLQSTFDLHVGDQ